MDATDESRKCRSAAVLRAAWKLSQFTIDQWRIQCGLPEGRRCTVHRVLNGASCADPSLLQRMLAVSAGIFGVPADDVLAYVELGELPGDSGIPAMLESAVWSPDPRRVKIMLEIAWLAGRKAKESISVCALMPIELMTFPVATAYHSALASKTAHADQVLKALNCYAKYRQLCAEQPDRPKRSVVLLSLRGLHRLVAREPPYQLCLARHIDECLETLRFVHMERDDLTIHIIDDRTQGGRHPWFDLYESLCVFDDRCTLRRMRFHPALLVAVATTSPSAAQMIANERSILRQLAFGSVPFRMDHKATASELETLLSPKSWYRRRLRP